MGLQGKWAQTTEDNWMYTDPDGKQAHGFVWTDYHDRWCWEAVVPRKARLNPSDGLSYNGYATTLEGAKRIVEVILQETGALALMNKPKNVLSDSATRLLDNISPESEQTLLKILGITPGRPLSGADIEEAIRRLGDRDKSPPTRRDTPKGYRPNCQKEIYNRHQECSVGTRTRLPGGRQPGTRG